MADSEEDSPVVGAVLSLLPRIPPAGDEVLSQVKPNLRVNCSQVEPARSIGRCLM